MNFFQKLKELKNLDKNITSKAQLLQRLDAQLQSKTTEVTNINEEIKNISQNKALIEAQRDAEIEKTKVRCEEAIQSYAERTAVAKSNFEENQKNYLKIKQELQQAADYIKLSTEKIKLIKSFLKKSYRQIEDDERLDWTQLNSLCPTVELELNSFDVKDLRKLVKENEKLINAVLTKYEAKYTTKANKTIYRLMVLAVRAELQNILIGLKFTNIDKSKTNLHEMLNKFLTIVSDGNQQIAPTIKAFISEVSPLLEQSIDIEHTYYVRKEQEKAEQQALREQMRQEAEEHKQLAAEQAKLEKEENKYKTEIEIAQGKLADCQDDTKIQQLLERIAELQNELNNIAEKKDDIVTRQNGKAGYVYVISNLGSFGADRFKIGMTRRLDPMDRVRELGDASVPFAFDVHCFIFSKDAVGLETELHRRLCKKRANKINLRKEFFDISIDELEELVNEICPTAEFKRTMLATEYRKGLEL